MRRVRDRILALWREREKHLSRLRGQVAAKPVMAGFGLLLFLFLLNLIALFRGGETRVLEHPSEVNFQDGRILNDRESTFYYGRERLLSQKAAAMAELTAKLEARVAELEKKSVVTPTSTGTDTSTSANTATGVTAGSVAAAGQGESGIAVYSPGTNFEGARFSGQRRGSRGLGGFSGPDLIAFPVKGEAIPEGVVLPAGSYVKAKILTGVDVPEGKTYPVLLVLDYSYVAPNDHKIDLSGCFMIAKAEGDLSTERVQMQASKMSCVSKAGKMFEREVNGFIADDRDGSFALEGKVNSKQGRVAAMAFMASVVDGVGKAVQAAQTTSTVNPLGGSSSILTGDSTKYLAAGGASNAAGMVAQWYLQQAQALAPTVSVGSGRDVWIVMKDKVGLPDEFFRKERKQNEGVYSYFSRVLD
ncbi:hypothetical protein FACS1894126_1350 [Alphaproteobacteria bacterium]|jgi:hypothetical protein|nr:hypothetical protein FACS1894126_1350 [Alphaproteobacteria bacterium]